jgi:hypothetical protein
MSRLWIRSCNIGHQEWLRFLKRIDRQTPKQLALHLIIDNYATTSPRRCGPGWRNIHAFICTLRLPRPRG